MILTLWRPKAVLMRILAPKSEPMHDLSKSLFRVRGVPERLMFSMRGCVGDEPRQKIVVSLSLPIVASGMLCGSVVFFCFARASVSVLASACASGSPCGSVIAGSSGIQPSFVPEVIIPRQSRDPAAESAGGCFPCVHVWGVNHEAKGNQNRFHRT